MGSCLFFSEYVEAGPGSANSFIEVFNGCMSTVNTVHYRLLLCRSGCPRGDPSALSYTSQWSGTTALPIFQNHPTLTPGESFVLAYCETVDSSRCADRIIREQADLTWRDLGDGNEVFGLLYMPYMHMGSDAAAHIVDQIGEVGTEASMCPRSRSHTCCHQARALYTPTH